MEQFFQDISSTYWWILLLVGLVVGVLCTFMADGIKKLWGLVSSRQRERNLEKEREIEDEIENLVNHPEEIGDYFIGSISLELASVRNLLFAIGAGLLAFFFIEIPFMVLVMIIVASVPYWMALRYLKRSNQVKRIAGEARTKARENSQ